MDQYRNPETTKGIEDAHQTGPSQLACAYKRLRRAEHEAASAIHWIRGEFERLEAGIMGPWRPGTRLENGYVFQEPVMVGGSSSPDYGRLERALGAVDEARMSIHAIETLLPKVPR